MSQTTLAKPPVDVSFSYSLQSSEPWVSSRGGYDKQDLKLGQSTQGAMEAFHVRVTPNGGGRTGAWHTDYHPFHFLFLTKGSGSLTTEKGNVVQLKPWTCVHQAGLFSRNRLEFSNDFEAIEIYASGKHPKSGGLINDDAQELTVTHETADSYVTGDGPRRFFGYRDLKTTKTTDRRVHIHVVKATIPMDTGTGWHVHTMSQQFYVIQGWADVSTSHNSLIRMVPIDAMCLGAGTPHDVSRFSPDYGVLEMCLPADYDTSEVKAPR